MAAAIPPSDTNVCFAELIVRLDSLLTLRQEENTEDAQQQPQDNAGQEDEAAVRQELEVDIKRKLTELHLRLKNGGSIHDNSQGVEEDDEDEAVEDSQGPSSAAEGTIGSVDCVGCSSAEDENEVCPSPHQPKGTLKNFQLFPIKFINSTLLQLRNTRSRCER